MNDTVLDEAIRRAAERYDRLYDLTGISSKRVESDIRRHIGPVIEGLRAERDEAVRKMTAREKKWDAMKKLTRQWHDLYHDMKRQLAAVREEYADYRKQHEAWREEAYRQLAAAREDTARLDWLIQQPAHIAYSTDGDDCWLHWSYDPNDEERGSFNQRGGFDSPREAIDAAREKGGAK